MPFVNSRLKVCTLPSVFYMLRTAGRGSIVKKTLKTHTTDHFMSLGILAAIRVSIENMSMKEYLDLQDSFPAHIVERKKNYFLENVRVIVFYV